MELENLLISLAETKAQELKSYIVSPDADDQQMRLEVTTAFIQLGQLIEFAHIADSGLSPASVERLLELESNKNALCRTFNWLYGI